MGCVADLVFYATAACMFAQVNYELAEREKAGTLGAPRGGGQAMTAPNCVEINQCVGCTRQFNTCLLYTSPSPRDMRRSRMPSSA